MIACFGWHQISNILIGGLGAVATYVVLLLAWIGLFGGLSRKRRQLEAQQAQERWLRDQAFPPKEH